MLSDVWASPLFLNTLYVYVLTSETSSIVVKSRNGGRHMVLPTIFFSPINAEMLENSMNQIFISDA